LIEIVTIWTPIYGIEGVTKAATALVSMIAATLLIPATPKALALRSPEELEALNERLRRILLGSKALLQKGINL
jgi:hypothetical protein